MRCKGEKVRGGEKERERERENERARHCSNLVTMATQPGCW